VLASLAKARTLRLTRRFAPNASSYRLMIINGNSGHATYDDRRDDLFCVTLHYFVGWDYYHRRLWMECRGSNFHERRCDYALFEAPGSRHRSAAVHARSSDRRLSAMV
jgi:hypothetical protein